MKKGFSDLTGVSEALVNNGTSTIVSIGANNNGVLIVKASISGSADFTGYLRMGSIDIIDYSDGGTTAATITQIENYFVPAGVAISMNSGNTKVNAHIVYRVL